MSTLIAPPRVAFVDGTGVLTRDGDRYIRGVFTRLGGSEAPTLTELSTAAADAADVSDVANSRSSDLTAEEARRGVEELRSEVLSLRGDVASLLALIAEMQTELLAVRGGYDLRPRVEALEDRLT